MAVFRIGKFAHKHRNTNVGSARVASRCVPSCCVASRASTRRGLLIRNGTSREPKIVSLFSSFLAAGYYPTTGSWSRINANTAPPRKFVTLYSVSKALIDCARGGERARDIESTDSRGEKWLGEKGNPSCTVNPSVIELLATIMCLTFARD